MEASSAIAWPFALGGAIAERLEWKTDGLDPPYGMEQTRKLRQAPRFYMDFDGQEKGAARRWLETQLAMNTAGLWHVPLATDAAVLGATALAGELAVAVETPLQRFVAGANAILVDRDNPRRHQVLEIDSVQVDGLTLATPLLDDWLEGSTIIPTTRGRLAEAPALSRFTGDAASYSVSFRSDDPMDWPADFGTAVYRSLPVFETGLDWSVDPVFTPARRIETDDNETGKVLLYDVSGILLPRIAFNVTLETATAAGAFRSLLYAMSGRWHPIWVPSFSQDVKIKAVASPTALNIEWMAFNAWPIQSNRRDIRIEIRNAAPIYRRITAAADIDSATEQLVLDDPLPAGFDLQNVVAVSFMALCRQDSDVNMLRVWSRGVVESQLSFAGCNYVL